MLTIKQHLKQVFFRQRHARVTLRFLMAITLCLTPSGPATTTWKYLALFSSGTALMPGTGSAIRRWVSWEDRRNYQYLASILANSVVRILTTCATKPTFMILLGNATMLVCCFKNRTTNPLSSGNSTLPVKYEEDTNSKSTTVVSQELSVASSPFYTASNQIYELLLIFKMLLKTNS